MTILKNTFKAILLSGLFILTSCSNDDDTPKPINEEEVINKVILTFENETETNTIILTSEDEDGEGGEAPEITQTGEFIKGETYTGSIEFFGAHGHDDDEEGHDEEEDGHDDEEEGHDDEEFENITQEIIDERNDHEIFYSIAEIVKTDKDKNGNPFGLKTSFTPVTVGEQDLNVQLRHEPTKPNTGINDAGGATEVDVDFTITIKEPTATAIQ